MIAIPTTLLPFEPEARELKAHRCFSCMTALGVLLCKESLVCRAVGYVNGYQGLITCP